MESQSDKGKSKYHPLALIINLTGLHTAVYESFMDMLNKIHRRFVVGTPQNRNIITLWKKFKVIHVPSVEIILQATVLPRK